MFQIWGDILDVHVYVWKSNLLFWQRSREPISSLYNSSLGQQNDLILWVFLLSRRCASSEPYPLFKPILRLWNPRTNCRICFSKRSLLFYWLLPRCGITAAYWSRVGITAAYWLRQVSNKRQFNLSTFGPFNFPTFNLDSSNGGTCNRFNLSTFNLSQPAIGTIHTK